MWRARRRLAAQACSLVEDCHAEVRLKEVRPTQVAASEVRVDQARVPKVWVYPRIFLSPFIPGARPQLENLEVFQVGHGLNLGIGGWKGILAWAERIAKGEWVRSER